jgi:hypothetical protein
MVKAAVLTDISRERICVSDRDPLTQGGLGAALLPNLDSTDGILAKGNVAIYAPER